MGERQSSATSLRERYKLMHLNLMLWLLRVGERFSTTGKIYGELIEYGEDEGLIAGDARFTEVYRLDLP